MRCKSNLIAPSAKHLLNGLHYLSADCKLVRRKSQNRDNLPRFCKNNWVRSLIKPVTWDQVILPSTLPAPLMLIQLLTFHFRKRAGDFPQWSKLCLLQIWMNEDNEVLIVAGYMSRDLDSLNGTTQATHFISSNGLSGRTKQNQRGAPAELLITFLLKQQGNIHWSAAPDALAITHQGHFAVRKIKAAKKKKKKGCNFGDI